MLLSILSLVYWQDSANFFSNERVISPLKALFIGVFPPVLHMQLLLIMNQDGIDMIALVNTVGLPLVLSNSAAIAIFTAMIAIVLREQENEVALASKQALTIAKEALPFLKKDSPFDVANGLVYLLYSRLRLAAVSISDQKEILAHKGLGEDQHRFGDSITALPAQKAIQLKQIQVAYVKADSLCTRKKCSLEAAIFIPITEDDQVTYLIAFHFEKQSIFRQWK